MAEHAWIFPPHPDTGRATVIPDETLHNTMEEATKSIQELQRSIRTLTGEFEIAFSIFFDRDGLLFGHIRFSRQTQELFCECHAVTALGF
jgi:hypothetical protein